MASIIPAVWWREEQRNATRLQTYVRGVTLYVMKVSATELRQNLYRILDSVIATGESVEVVRKTGSVRIMPLERRSIWDSLEVHDVVSGEIEVDWTRNWDGEPEVVGE